MEKAKIESEPKISFKIENKSRPPKIEVYLKPDNQKSEELLLKLSRLFFDYQGLKNIPYGESAKGLVLATEIKFPDDEVFSWEEGAEHLAKENIEWKKASEEALSTMNKIKEFAESADGAKKIEEMSEKDRKLDLEYDKAKIALAKEAILATTGEPPAQELKRVK